MTEFQSLFPIRTLNPSLPISQLVPSRAIKDIKVGDKVLATDPETGRTEARRVDTLITGDGDKKLVEIAGAVGHQDRCVPGEVVGHTKIP
ncbi:hypothetical protein [Actinoallomurus sp. NPDC050550]|uniref:hypothetical protein n=1 Tax=Actinoallomurus sp. NPDC050550 TaxID=3154937 RepID=UPI0033D48E20